MAMLSVLFGPSLTQVLPRQQSLGQFWDNAAKNAKHSSIFTYV